MQLLGDAVTCKPFCVHGANNCGGRWVDDWGCLSPACEPVNYSQNGLRRNAETKRALAADYIDVECSEWLVGWPVTEWHAGRQIGVAVSVARLTSFQECGDLTTNARPPQSLRYAPESGFVTVVCRFMYGTENFLSKHCGHDDSSGNSTLVNMLQEVLLDEELSPYIKV